MPSSPLRNLKAKGDFHFAILFRGHSVKKPNTPLLAFVGDLMLGRRVDEQMNRRAPWSFWGTARPLLSDADAVFANLECAITNVTEPRLPDGKERQFRARPQAVEVLRAGNINCVSLANNHVFDFGREGLLDTLACLDAVGIKHAGAGRNLCEAMAPTIVAAGGLRVAFTALTNMLPETAAGEDSAGVFYVDLDAPSQWEPALESAARLADAQGPDLRVLSGHLGHAAVSEPSPQMIAFTEAALYHGFDIYHGHSAHVLQGVRALGGKLIMHDTGNFLGDYEADSVLHNDWSAVFQVEASKDGLQRLRISPVQLSFARVDFAEGATVEGVVERMFGQCEKLGTIPECDDEGLTVEIT
jgi:poly-gamma-glutamate capsule biosynthesis protein CapA/YwtB (metallophosphatase superfamily)